jgi:hypothetical protein
VQNNLRKSAMTKEEIIEAMYGNVLILKHPLLRFAQYQFNKTDTEIQATKITSLEVSGKEKKGREVTFRFLNENVDVRHNEYGFILSHEKARDEDCLKVQFCYFVPQRERGLAYLARRRVVLETNFLEKVFRKEDIAKLFF